MVEGLLDSWRVVAGRGGAVVLPDCWNFYGEGDERGPSTCKGVKNV